MTIWILTVLLLAGLAGLGYRQGGIRAGFSFVGILFGFLFATILGHLFRPLLAHMNNPVMAWAIAPFIGFMLVLIIFKIAGHFVHRKVEVHFKYKLELQLKLWRRLNHRLGLCLGALNGAAYLILLCFVIFNFSYWTVQLVPADEATGGVKFLNRLGRDLESSRMDRVGRAVATMPVNYYKFGDLAGLFFQNPNLTTRLAYYPPALSLEQRDDVKQLTQDEGLKTALQNRMSLKELFNQAQIKTFLQNHELMETVRALLTSNLDDLLIYLKTGKSAAYDSMKILGRWNYSPTTAFGTLIAAKPDISSSEMRTGRDYINQNYAQAEFIAGSDHQAFLKNLPQVKTLPNGGATNEMTDWQGEWSEALNNYSVNLSHNGETKSMTAQVSGSQLTLKDSKTTIIFNRDNSAK